MMLLLFLLLLLLPIYLFFPKPRTSITHADCILVLGCPTHADGSLCNAQIRRCNKAIELWMKQTAPLILISGGKAHNEYCEAEAMADYIHKKHPEIPVLIEGQAANTYDNFKYAEKLCAEHDLYTIAVVTSSSHCCRAAYFARKFFTDFAMIADGEPFSIKKYTREFFAKYNTLICEIKIKLKHKNQI